LVFFSLFSQMSINDAPHPSCKLSLERALALALKIDKNADELSLCPACLEKKHNCKIFSHPPSGALSPYLLFFLLVSFLFSIFLPLLCPLSL
jgi:hypothetical protein